MAAPTHVFAAMTTSVEAVQSMPTGDLKVAEYVAGVVRGSSTVLQGALKDAPVGKIAGALIGRAKSYEVASHDMEQAFSKATGGKAAEPQGRSIV